MPPIRFKHNPSHMSDDELIREFVVREADLAAVTEVLAENHRSDSTQHLLILGPRGMGKTTLVNRVIAEVRRNPARTGAWLPVAFDEESYTVTSAGELWALALTHMAEQTGDRNLRQVADRLQSIQDHRHLGEVALARMLEHAKATSKRILLVLENLDMLFEQQMSDKEAWTIRHTLQNEPSIMLLATSTTRLDAFHDRKRAFYDFFREYPLERLDLAECQTVWRMVTGRDLPVNQARPIQIFTGGNTRLLVILASFARERSFRELMDDLVGLIDEHTPYFKHNVEALPSDERKVFVTLADLWSPATTRQVAEQSRGNINKVSTFLGRLAQRGAVEVVRNIGKVKFYQVVERMYNLYHLLRRRGETRVRGVVEFMVRYYDGDEMRDMLGGMAKEACSLSETARMDHVRAFLGVIRRLPDPTSRRGIVDGLQREFLDLPEVMEELRYIITPNAKVERSEDELRAAVAANPHDIDSRIDLARVLRTRGLHDEALDLLGEAFALNPSSRRISDEFLGLVGDISARGALNEKLDRLSNSFVTNATGDALPLMHVARALWLTKSGAVQSAQNILQKAQTILTKIIDRWPADVMAMAWAGGLLNVFDRHDEGRQAIEHALDVAPGNAIALRALAHVSRDSNDLDRVEALLREFVRFHPSNETGWMKLVDFLDDRRDDPRSAEAVLIAARTANPDNPAFRRALARRWLSEGRYPEAEAELDHLVTRMGDDASRSTLYVCLRTQGKRTEADDVINPTEPDQASGEILGMCAIWAIVNGKAAESRLTLDRARAIDPSNFAVLLADILMSVAERDLVQWNRKVEELFERDSSSLNDFASSIDCMLFPDSPPEFVATAVELVRRAVKESPSYLPLQFALAHVLARSGQWIELKQPLARYLGAPILARRRFKQLVDIGTLAAAHGQGAMIAEVFAASASASLFEPLIVACRRSAGEVVDPPQEVGEVADDILRDIEKLRPPTLQAAPSSPAPTATPTQRPAAKATKKAQHLKDAAPTRRKAAKAAPTPAPTRRSTSTTPSKRRAPR